MTSLNPSKLGDTDIASVMLGTATVDQLYLGTVSVWKRLVTLTINPTPSDATVTFSTGEVSGNTVTVTLGTTVTYTVSKSNYVTSSTPVTLTASQTIPVTLTPIYTLTINPNPADSTVTLVASGYTQSGNSISVPNGTNVNVTVARSGLSSYTSLISVTSNNTQNITLTYPSGTVLFESSTPGNYSVTPMVPVTCNIICVGGGGSGAGTYYNQNVTDYSTEMPTSTWYYCGVAAGGGSGGYSNVNVSLLNQSYSVVVGNSGGVSSAATVSANPGGNGSVNWSSYPNPAWGTPGSGGKGSTKSGNPGGSNSTGWGEYSWSTSASGGGSVYGGYGAGGGGSSTGSSGAGGVGYVKITTV